MRKNKEKKSMNSNELTQGAVLLTVWIEENDIQQRALAEAIDVKQPSVSDYVQGNVVPRIKTAMAIEKVTQGAVPLVSWTTKANKGDIAKYEKTMVGAVRKVKRARVA